MPIDKEENELIRQRLTKLEAIKKEGMRPYGGMYEVTSSIGKLKESFA